MNKVSPESKQHQGPPSIFLLTLWVSERVKNYVPWATKGTTQHNTCTMPTSGRKRKVAK